MRASRSKKVSRVQRAEQPPPASSKAPPSNRTSSTRTARCTPVLRSSKGNDSSRATTTARQPFASDMTSPTAHGSRRSFMSPSPWLLDAIDLKRRNSAQQQQPSWLQRGPSQQPQSRPDYDSTRDYNPVCDCRDCTRVREKRKEQGLCDCYDCIIAKQDTPASREHREKVKQSQSHRTQRPKDRSKTEFPWVKRLAISRGARNVIVAADRGGQ
ncbi:unnamed protein product [Nippostrongylus brasiliensis]|uniref:Uncharacterized protein n=1 Tax=Nippostrongylus brasiliensis TaxID=27835 RepID=A0A0N4XZ02_NIPBR|nr:unnamed protein product [Nippostrongylus brasiliensis]